MIERNNMYITYTDVGNFLNISLNASGQSLVTSIITGVEAFVNRECNRKWNNTDGSPLIEKFDGNGQTKFFPKQIPIKSITSITSGGDALAATDYFNYSSYIRINFPVFTEPQGLIITYVSDAQAIPDDLKQGMIQWAAQIFKSHDDAGKVASRVTTGSGIAVDYLTKDGVPLFMEQLIASYRVPNI